MERLKTLVPETENEKQKRTYINHGSLSCVAESEITFFV